MIDYLYDFDYLFWFIITEWLWYEWVSDFLILYIKFCEQFIISLKFVVINYNVKFSSGCWLFCFYFNFMWHGIGARGCVLCGILQSTFYDDKV